jgi:hypothetical protein
VDPRGKTITDHGVPPDPRQFQPVEGIDPSTITTALGEPFDRALAVSALDQIINTGLG